MPREEAAPEAQAEAVLKRLAGRRVVASVSGGKDSAALSLWLTELGIDHDRVFLDTGWEADLTYEYLRGELTRALGPIVEVRGPRTMEELVKWKMAFASTKRRFCTQFLKVQPMAAYLNARIEAGEDLVNAVGVRADESAARARLPEWEMQEAFDCEVWRPLLRWTVEDVVAIHQRHGLRPNPLYLLGAQRVGCWPCINSTKAEVKLISEVDPGRITRLRILEQEVGELRRASAERKGEPFRPPGWFQARLRQPDGTFPCWPIDKVVAWSKTSRGGRQFELFAADPADAGCMRWGLCETKDET